MSESRESQAGRSRAAGRGRTAGRSKVDDPAVLSRPSGEGSGTITALVTSGRREGRYEVEVEGTAIATVSVQAVAAMKLHVGLQLDERAFAALVEEGAVVAACDRALNILGFRDRSAVELRRALIKKGVEAGPAAAAVVRLTDSGLVDDARYARAVARSKALNAGASRRRIEQELARRGVPRDVADEAIGDVWVEEEVDQVAAATALARKRAPSLARLDSASRKRRMYGFLARRGYSGEEIRQALAAVAAGEDHADEDNAGDDDAGEDDADDGPELTLE